MGQRFQILVKVDDEFSLYHAHWLWGAHAIRRIGTAIKHYSKHEGYNAFEESLKCSFYRLNDTNSFSDYFNSEDDLKAEIASKSIIQTLKGLDNNDGYFVINIQDRKIIGHCFVTNNLQLVSARDFILIEGVGVDLDKFQKKQRLEYESNLKLFDKLPLMKSLRSLKRIKKTQVV